MLRRALVAEGLGSLLLAATVIGSGIMAERLAGYEEQDSAPGVSRVVQPPGCRLAASNNDRDRHAPLAPGDTARSRRSRRRSSAPTSDVATCGILYTHRSTGNYRPAWSRYVWLRTPGTPTSIPELLWPQTYRYPKTKSTRPPTNAAASTERTAL